jgi:hypothetical protein
LGNEAELAVLLPLFYFGFFIGTLLADLAIQFGISFLNKDHWKIIYGLELLIIATFLYFSYPTIVHA